MNNNDNILNDFSVLENLDQQVKDADDNLVEALKQNEDRLYDVVKITFPVPVLNFSLIFNDKMHAIIINSMLLTLLSYLIILCYSTAIVLYGISYLFGVWDSAIKRNQLNEYCSDININAVEKDAITKLSDFLNSYNRDSENSKLNYARQWKRFSLGFVLFGFLFFVVLIILLLGGSVRLIYPLLILLSSIIFVIWLFERKYKNG